MLKNYSIFKVEIVDIDYGTYMTGITAKNGKIVFSVMMKTEEAIKAMVEKNREAYCVLLGKDVIIFRDFKYFASKFISNRKILEEYSGKILT
ncbi:MAG: hypothetical protein PWQ25_1082 [Deferribacteres bacterium]|jgi:hypothetical protein|nr:hypothetical protein [Deferribacteraceae bacterium]MDK2792219.1 hypothetical protein [Deferribacteres bacterium]